MPAQPAVCLLSRLCACSAGCVPAQPAVCLLRLLCACSAGCVPLQAAMCLLGLLCTTIQLSMLCACSAYCVPQYSLLYWDLIFRKWAVAHSSSSNLFPFFSNPPVASLPLLGCSSLDHCNSYNSKIFKSFIFTLFLCKNWKKFQEFCNTIYLCSKLELLSRKKKSFNSEPLCPKFLKPQTSNLGVMFSSTLIFHISSYAIHQSYKHTTIT